VSDANSSTPLSRDKEPIVYLVGSCQPISTIIKCCPSATTWECVELATDKRAIIAIPCKRWGCKWCGQKKAFHLAAKCETAKPNRLITLTVAPAFFESPHQAYQKTRRKVADFAKTLRKTLKEFAYFRVLEATKAGWPHYHFLARCPYIPQPTISRVWNELTGAPIVDVRAIKTGMNVFKYVLKYLCKQTHIPWTNRRISWSHDFFPKPETTARRHNPYVEGVRRTQHPADFIQAKYPDQIIVQRQPGVWVVDSVTVPPNQRHGSLQPTSYQLCRKSPLPSNE